MQILFSCDQYLINFTKTDSLEYLIHKPEATRMKCLLTRDFVIFQSVFTKKPFTPATNVRSDVQPM